MAIIGGLANGPCRVTNFLPSEDCLNTLRAMEALGVKCEKVASNDYGPTELILHGRKMELKAPKGPIDCANGSANWWIPLIFPGLKWKGTKRMMCSAACPTRLPGRGLG